jgi:hypothetical protein
MKNDPPLWAQCKGEDNRAVLVPLWAAKEILEMLGRYRNKIPPPMLAAYASQEQDRVEDLKNLIDFTENNHENDT